MDPRDGTLGRGRPPHRRPRGRDPVAAQRPDLPRVGADDHCRVLRLLADRRDELTSERRRTINRLHRHLRDLIAGGPPTASSTPRKPPACSLRSVPATASSAQQMARDLLVDVRRQLTQALPRADVRRRVRLPVADALSAALHQSSLRPRALRIQRRWLHRRLILGKPHRRSSGLGSFMRRPPCRRALPSGTAPIDSQQRRRRAHRSLHARRSRQ